MQPLELELDALDSRPEDGEFVIGIGGMLILQLDPLLALTKASISSRAKSSNNVR